MVRVGPGLPGLSLSEVLTSIAHVAMRADHADEADPELYRTAISEVRQGISLSIFRCSGRWTPPGDCLRSVDEGLTRSLLHDSAIPVEAICDDRADTAAGDRPHARHNASGYIADAAQSVFAQGVDDLELLAIDDGSIDGCIDELMALGDSRIRVVAQANAGLVAALNRGLDEAAGRSSPAWMPTTCFRRGRLRAQLDDG